MGSGLDRISRWTLLVLKIFLVEPNRFINFKPRQYNKLNFQECTIFSVYIIRKLSTNHKYPLWSLNAILTTLFHQKDPNPMKIYTLSTWPTRARNALLTVWCKTQVLISPNITNFLLKSHKLSFHRIARTQRHRVSSSALIVGL